MKTLSGINSFKQCRGSEMIFIRIRIHIFFWIRILTWIKRQPGNILSQNYGTYTLEKKISNVAKKIRKKTASGS
jgi:hypothetical protein